MKVLLINPPSIESGFFSEISIPRIPFSLAYIGSYLENHNVSVEILDMYINHNKEEIKRILKNKEFMMIGITLMTPYVRITYDLARILKKNNPDVPIVLGGWHPTALPENTLKECKDIDLIVVGEGHETLLELSALGRDKLKDIETLYSIKGLCFRDGDQIKRTPNRPLCYDLDALPFPGLDLLKIDSYASAYNLCFVSKRKEITAMVITSRGCPYQCVYCADRTINERTIRFRSIERILAEIKSMILNFKVGYILIIDPNFLQDPERVIELCRGIIKNKLKIHWACQGRVDRVSQKLLSMMRIAGCQRIFYGIESGSPRVLKRIKKNIKIRQIIDAVSWTKEAGIRVTINIMLGLPGETERDMLQTFHLVKKLKPHGVYINITKPLPGSELFEDEYQDKLRVSSQDADWKDFYMSLHVDESRKFTFRNVDLPIIEKYHRKIMLSSYLNVFFIQHVLSEMRTINHLKFYVKVFIMMLSAVFSNRKEHHQESG